MTQVLKLAFAISAILGLALTTVPFRTVHADAPIVFFVPTSVPQLSSDTKIFFLKPTGDIVPAPGCSNGGELAGQNVVIIMQGEGATRAVILIERVIDQSGEFHALPLPIQSQPSSIEGGESTCSIGGVDYRAYTAQY
jgi:hypothetical protein